MKSLNIYINEKLVINKNSEIEKEQPKSSFSSRKIWLPYPDHRDDMKMREYRKKGSNPDRLVASIKDKDKLLRRLRWAKENGWTSCARVFGNAAVTRGYYKQEEIDAYLNN